MMPNSEQNEDIVDNRNEKNSQGDETTIGSDHELQSVNVCAGKPNKLRKVTIKAAHFIGATQW